MDLRDVLNEQNQQFGEKYTLAQRAVLGRLEPFLNLKETILVTGIRRCGKSSLLKLICDTHLKDAYFYVNFDDERLSVHSDESGHLFR